MKLLKIFLALIINFSIAFSLQAQGMLHGTVRTIENGKRVPLQGASVHWQGTSLGAITDSTGHFMLDRPDSSYINLVVAYMGLNGDTLTISPKDKTINIILETDYTLGEVIIKADTKGAFISNINVQQTEVTTGKELLRAACCNLSESFETNPSVDVSFTDAVTGARQIRLLGLDGVYTQFQRENIPTLRGLNGVFGLTSVPGPWIESIQVGKGAGTVVNGYESMAGQINLEMIKPQNAPKFFLNLYQDANGRSELNVTAGKKINARLSTALFTHGQYAGTKIDRNGDGFLDLPLTKDINIMNRWHYSDGKKIESQFGIDGNYQERAGGQTFFNPKTDIGTRNAYGAGSDNLHLGAYAKLGRMYADKPWKSIGSMYAASYHDLNAYYGLNLYHGIQKSFYANVIYQGIIGNTERKFKTGASFQYDAYHETFNDFTGDRIEGIPGVFGEYTFTVKEKLTVVSGLRADYFRLDGLKFSPRIHTKLAITDNLAIRASAGRGYRIADVWTENSAAWVSSRKIVFLENPAMESSWNYGGSLLYNFKIMKKKGSVLIDAFRTDFTGQVIADMDEDPLSVIFYNLKGRSFANSLQAELTYEPIKNLTFTTAWKYYDVRTTYHGELLQKPLVPTKRFMATAGYLTKHKKYAADLTGQWYGHSRLPASHDAEGLYAGTQSPAYWIVHAQLTRNFKKWSIYAGAENLLNFKQPNPVIGYNDPFGPHFDAGMVWGPVEGRKIYAGIRLTLDRN